jgi:transposase InsO family protein
MNNWVLVEKRYLPGDPEARVADFVDYYDHQRYHESLDNLTPADLYFGRGQAILAGRARTKRKTMALRRQLHQKTAA